jgi:hypothetical protein
MAVMAAKNNADVTGRDEYIITQALATALR